VTIQYVPAGVVDASIEASFYPGGGGGYIVGTILGQFKRDSWFNLGAGGCVGCTGARLI